MKGLPVGPEAVRAPWAAGGRLRGRTWLPSQQSEAVALRSGPPVAAFTMARGLRGSRSQLEPLVKPSLSRRRAKNPDAAAEV